MQTILSWPSCSSFRVLFFGLMFKRCRPWYSTSTTPSAASTALATPSPHWNLLMAWKGWYCSTLTLFFEVGLWWWSLFVKSWTIFYLFSKACDFVVPISSSEWHLVLEIFKFLPVIILAARRSLRVSVAFGNTTILCMSFQLIFFQQRANIMVLTVQCQLGLLSLQKTSVQTSNLTLLHHPHLRLDLLPFDRCSLCRSHLLVLRSDLILEFE